MKVLFVCGGTAGHINPALAVAGELRELLPDVKILFVGSGRRLERELIPRAGYELRNIDVTGLMRGFSAKKAAHNIRAMRHLVSAGAQSARILRSFKPDAVLGTGGYVCYPALKKASRLGIPTIIHESNAAPGLTAKLLSGCADAVLTAFPGTEEAYRRPERVRCVGTPVRSEFHIRSREESRRALGIGEGPLVVSFWGSLGAEKMNAVTAEMIKINRRERAFSHIHATGGGAGGVEAMLGRIGGDMGDNTRILSYIDDMPRYMAAADLVVCRAGASTIAELRALRKPSILAPSPYVTNNHQEKNALELEKSGGAVLIREEGCTGEILFDRVKALVTDAKALGDMRKTLSDNNSKNAAREVAEIIIAIAG